MGATADPPSREDGPRHPPRLPGSTLRTKRKNGAEPPVADGPSGGRRGRNCALSWTLHVDAWTGSTSRATLHFAGRICGREMRPRRRPSPSRGFGAPNSAIEASAPGALAAEALAAEGFGDQRRQGASDQDLPMGEVDPMSEADPAGGGAGGPTRPVGGPAGGEPVGRCLRKRAWGPAPTGRSGKPDRLFRRSAERSDEGRRPAIERYVASTNHIPTCRTRAKV